MSYLLKNLQKYLLCETLSADEIEQMRAELSVPEILPCTFDVTVPGWLERIKTWGQITIKHEDPENHWGKRTVTINKFLDGITNDDLNRMLGKFHIVKHGLTSCSFDREYVGKNGKKYKERFIIDVKLKKELR